MNLNVDIWTAIGLVVLAAGVAFALWPVGGPSLSLPTWSPRRPWQAHQTTRRAAERLAAKYPPDLLAAAFLLAKRESRPDDLLTQAKAMTEAPGPITATARD